jgi:hypothetical protein
MGKRSRKAIPVGDREIGKACEKNGGLMRTVILFGLMYIAQAINPPLIEGMGKGTMKTIAIIFSCAILMDIIEFIDRLGKKA